MPPPTKFKQEFCNQLIDHLESGLSFESFAGVVGVTEKTLFNWRDAFPEFKNAKDVGWPKCRLYWEKRIRDADKDDNSACLIFNLKNRFGWRDKKDIDVGGKDGAPSIKVIIEEFVSSGSGGKGEPKSKKTKKA